MHAANILSEIGVDPSRRSEIVRNRPGIPGRMVRCLWQLGLALLLGWLSLPSLVAQDFRVTSIGLTPEGMLVVQYESSADSYYILRHGETVTSVTAAVQLTLGGDGTGQTIHATSPGSNAAFYRVHRVPVTAPLDSDGDQIDDVYELRHSTDLNPLDPADAGQPAGDGLTWLERYRAETGLRITLDPVSQTVNPGDPVRFTVVAAGSPELLFQWRRDGKDLLGEMAASLNIASALPADEGSYDCVVTNPAGSATSAAATLTVRMLPRITLDPASQTVNPGDSVHFAVSADGSPALLFQWRKGGDILPGETSSSLNIAIALPADAGSYDCVVTNPAGSATSAAATLTVRSAETLPLATIAGSSPANGEGNVSVNRETIFRLSLPLAASTVLANSTLSARFAGRSLLTRREISSDGKTVTLFYLEPLPAGARVRVTFEGGGLTDAFGRPLDLDADGIPGGVAVVDFDTASVAVVPATAVVGHVYASEKNPDGSNRPLQEVTVTVDGAEETLRTTTDANGAFTLANCPAGRFFVHVDGRTAVGSDWPNGSYYPFIGKAWEAAAGRADNLAAGTGEIFLPLVPANALQAVSATAPTRITFPPEVVAANPALAGVEVLVPANALFDDNGTRGGRVGLAPVPPDRLPEPLPAGLNFPLVITIQTDGPQNFDRPVPVRFPNLPDPVTGQKLPPGAKSALWSFNHDTGRWELQGPMTVTADGNYVETDPGVGVRQPGWHGNGQPPAGPPLPCPDCPRCFTHCFEELNVEAKQVLINELACHLIGTVVDPFAPGASHVVCKMVFSVEIILLLTEHLKCVLSCVQGTSLSPADQHSSGIKLHGFGAKSGLTDTNSVFLQIAEKAAQIENLLTPYATSNVVPPLQVVRQAYSLVQDANALAGGDVVAYLDQILVSVEAADAAAGETGGNAPSYPIRYAATIEQPGGDYVLRGITEAYGQYSLFVPSGEQLRSVVFYDLKASSIGISTPNLRGDARYRMPAVVLYPIDSLLPDTDGDGLPDVAEFVVGSDSSKSDTDGDGIPDGAELAQGTDPLDGRPVATGVIASASSDGNAVDVCALNDLAITANSDAGIAVFQVASGTNPLRIAQVDTPGTALAVGCAGARVAVADGPAGLAIIDITDPPAARIVSQLPLAGSAQAVAVAGDTAFVGSTSGDLMAVDLPTGAVLDLASLGGRIEDLFVEGDHLHAYANAKLQILPLNEFPLRVIGSVPSTDRINNAHGRGRLFVGGGTAYLVHWAGYNTFDVTDPTRPVQRLHGVLQQFGWKGMVLNGSGLAVVAASPNSTFDGPHNVDLYRLGANNAFGTYLTTFVTPGIARAVSVFNGLAYVADGDRGLEVINYLAYDTQGKPPAIQLATSIPLQAGVARIEEGKPVRLTADVTDDVQVRNVEFYLDGERVMTDGSFPFEHRFTTPARTDGKTNFLVKARAFDTGGNAAWSQELSVELTGDVTPPVVRRAQPGDGALGPQTDTVFVFFNEPLNPATVSGAIRLTYAGADSRFDTGDDLVLSGGVTGYRETLNAAVLQFPTPLAYGLYRGEVTAPLSDLAGNVIVGAFRWNFAVLVGDSLGDDDADGLSNADELQHGTNPLLRDTDGDGWDDGVELVDDFDPLDPESAPRRFFAAQPPVELVIGRLESSTWVARPGIEVSPAGSGADAVLVMARPPVELVPTGAGGEAAMVLARPPVEISPSTSAGGDGPVTIAQPPVLVERVAAAAGFPERSRAQFGVPKNGSYQPLIPGQTASQPNNSTSVTRKDTTQ